MANEFKSTLPATISLLVTPDNDNDLPRQARSLYIGVGGDIKFTTINDTTDTWTVPSGFYLLEQIKRVFAAGTTASDIHLIV